MTRWRGRSQGQGQGRLQLAGVDLETLAIQGVAAGQVLAQESGGALAKLSPTAGIHPVGHGDDGIQIIAPVQTADLTTALLLN